MILYFFMEVKCIGNTQIIHMEETGITQRTIGLMSTVLRRTLFFSSLMGLFYVVRQMTARGKTQNVENHKP